jgi:hypothetical protein
LSIFIEDNDYAGAVKADLTRISHPQADPHLCDLRGPTFLPPVPMAIGDKVSSGTYFKVDYPAPTHPSDPGAQLLSKLANYRPKHIFVHGVRNDFRWTYYDPRGSTLTKFISEEGGGLTTDMKSQPHVDLYIDGSETNVSYPITIKQDHCFISISERNPYVRLYHELLHAEGLIFGLAHGHWTVIPKTNEFRRQRGLGYERVLPLMDSIERTIRTW